MEELQFPPDIFNWTGQTEIWGGSEGLFDLSRQHYFESYLEWAKSIAYQLFSVYKIDGLESDDYVQHATIGLLEAIDNYDPSKGVPFKAYAHKRVKGSVLNSIVKYSESSCSSHWQNKRIKERARSVSDANKSEETKKALIETILDLAVGFIAEEKAEFEEDTCIQDTTLNSTEIKVLAAKIRDMFELLSTTEQAVMESHYVDSKSLVDIAQKQGVTIGRVSQIHSQAIKKIRKRLRW